MKKVLIVVAMLIVAFAFTATKPTVPNESQVTEYVYVNDTVKVDSTKLKLKKQKAAMDSLLNKK